MNGLDRVAVPVTALYDPAVGTWRVMPEIFSATEIEQWAISLKNNSKQNKPDMATPSKPSD
jgi:P2-related tail formation protein